MVRHQISLTESQTKKLEKEKRETGLGKSEVIRRAVDRYFGDDDQHCGCKQ